MAFENLEQAAAALAESVSAPDVQPAQPAQAAPTEPSQPVVEPAATVTGDQGQPQQPVQAEEGFTPSKDIDLSGLSDEQRAFLTSREREMQADYTRKTQELAQERQAAAEAVQFVNDLNTDPYLALQVVNTLSSQLTEAGFSPAQAQAGAERGLQQMQQGQQPSINDLGLDDDGFDDDPYLAEINEVKQQTDSIRQYLAQQEEQNRVVQLEAQLNNAVAYVQSQNPDFTDADMSKIVNMAWAYNGDIPRAASEYKAIRESAVEAWMNRKESVQAPAPIAGGAPAQSAPESFEDLNDPRLEQAALARLNAVLGNQ